MLRVLAPDTEQFRAADGTDALDRLLTILHGYVLRVLHVSLAFALHTIGLSNVRSPCQREHRKHRINIAER